jgi:hypothetical protein
VRPVKYWIVCVSEDHSAKGFDLGITQACHGKIAPLKRMQKGDYIILYSGKKSLDSDIQCQKFTNIGKIKDDEIYQVEMSKNFIPFRRNVEYYPCEAISIALLINDLDFIQNKKFWGYPFRFGFFEIKENDFKLISAKLLKKQYV